MSNNKTKQNKVLSFDELNALVIKSLNNDATLIKSYISSDAKSQQYTGLNDFSINLKVKSYNVYMSDANATVCKSVDDTLTVEVNSGDNTKKQLRCRLIKFELSQLDILKKCLLAIVESKKVNA